MDANSEQCDQDLGHNAGRQGFGNKGKASRDNRLTKVNYRPIEAAVRWCGLADHEADIIDALDGRVLPEPSDFPEWPGLRLAAERIQDAILNRELPVGENGITVSDGSRVAGPELTIRHLDLKTWMIRCYPEDRPDFLFSELERNVYPGISIEVARTLSFERDSLKSLVAERDEEISALRTELHALLKSVEANTRPGTSNSGLSSRGEITYLHIIGALLNLMLGHTPSGQPYSSFRTQDSIVAALMAHYGDRVGIGERTLNGKFAAAKRKLAQI